MAEWFYPEEEVRVITTQMGADLSVQVFGGDKPHVGAVSVWSQELQKVETVVLPGHKEGIVTEKLAVMIGQKKVCNISVTAGIHYDLFTEQKRNMVMELIERIAMDLSK